MKLRKANLEDCPYIAALHYKNISAGFLSQLGEKFLLCLYKAILSFPSGIVIVAVDDNGQVIGL